MCKLHKSIYGLKQASRQWFSKFSAALLDERFKQSQSDHTLFSRRASDTSFTALLVYVDDIVIASNDEAAVNYLKVALSKRFKMKDLGSLKYFLGLEIARSKSGITPNQRKYTLELLAETGVLNCKPASIPLDPNVRIS